MENKGLLFIPDISGFTRFVNAAEIGHSKLIIQELLEVLVNANQTGLEISEIEGDAILFYKFGNPPSLEELYRQVERMFCEFHKSLVTYEQQRYCWCDACKTAIDLSLKVITHYGEFTGYSVKTFNKLIGKDVIVAHQLLKNDIQPHEYWLVTDDLLQQGQPASFTEWMRWNNGSKETEIGQLPYRYTHIGSLKETISPETPAGINLAGMQKMFSLEREYDTDLVHLFHVSGDFNTRDRWMEGVKKILSVTHSLPQVGMQCRCITDKGELTISSNSFVAEKDRIEFTETYGNRNILHHYVLEELGPGRTRLTFEYYIPGSKFAGLLFNLSGKKKAMASMERSLDKIAELLRSLPAENAGSTAS